MLFLEVSMMDLVNISFLGGLASQSSFKSFCFLLHFVPCGILIQVASLLIPRKRIGHLSSQLFIMIYPKRYMFMLKGYNIWHLQVGQVCIHDLSSISEISLLLLVLGLHWSKLVYQPRKKISALSGNICYFYSFEFSLL